MPLPPCNVQGSSKTPHWVTLKWTLRFWLGFRIHNRWGGGGHSNQKIKEHFQVHIVCFLDLPGGHKWALAETTLRFWQTLLARPLIRHVEKTKWPPQRATALASLSTVQGVIASCQASCRRYRSSRAWYRNGLILLNLRKHAIVWLVPMS